MDGKKDHVLAPFFSSQRHWRFGELLERVNISRPQLAEWLRRLANEGVILRVKKRGKMPYYLANTQGAGYRMQKRLFGLTYLNNCGLLKHLASLRQTRAVVLFGSFSRSDWDAESDIDVFIYGSDEEFEKGKFERMLKREIQVHNAKNKSDVRKMSKLLPSIISGNFIKGSVQDLGVKINA